MWAVLAAVAIGWVVFRIVVIASESARVVYNPVRDSDARGAAVEKITVNKKTGVLREPMAVKNNRAFVSCARIGKFRVGQEVVNGQRGGKIISVSDRIDLDSGMCIVKTSGVSDGPVFVESKYIGYFVPVYAVVDNRVMVDDNGTSSFRNVTVVSDDSENAVVSGGLSDGDVVIISQIDEGAKVR